MSVADTWTAGDGVINGGNSAVATGSRDDATQPLPATSAPPASLDSSVYPPSPRPPNPLRRAVAVTVALGALVIPGMLVVGDQSLPRLDQDREKGRLLPALGYGDVLGLLSNNDPNALGVNGRLPEADTISPELLAALRDPTRLADGGLTGGLTGSAAIPSRVLDAYRAAERSLAASTPRCGIHWSVLAGIGKIESNHARGGQIDPAGTTISPILGPVLNGTLAGTATIRDTDGGRLDGDSQWDRAMGPMQFIPGTWQAYASDGNNDGVRSPHNIFDAAAAAGRYLCAGGLNLRDPLQLGAAVRRYNRSDKYVWDVLRWAGTYAGVVTPPGEPTPPPIPPLPLPPGVQPPPAPEPEPSEPPQVETPKPPEPSFPESPVPTTPPPNSSTVPSTTVPPPPSSTTAAPPPSSTATTPSTPKPPATSAGKPTDAAPPTTTTGRPSAPPPMTTPQQASTSPTRPTGS